MKAWFDDDEWLEQVADELREALIDRVMTNIADKLDDESLIALQKFYDSGQDQEDIYAFLAAHIQDYDAFMDQTYASFEKMYLDAMQDDEEKSSDQK